MDDRNVIVGVVLRVSFTELTIQFEDGSSARLDPADHRSPRMAALLDALRQRKGPAYVEVDPSLGFVRLIRIPLVVRVETLAVDPSGDVHVMFEHSHGRYTIRHDSSDYEELLGKLRQAREARSWLLMTPDDAQQIIDVRPFAPASAPPFDLPSREPPSSERVAGRWWNWWRLWFRCVSATRAQQLFDLCAATTCDPLTVPPPCIPFNYPDDGCWGRAHEMARLMIDDGAKPRKVWIFASENGRLLTQTSNNPSCVVSWYWHVAPTLCVRKYIFKTEEQVIDPSLFTTPVPIATWKGVQGDPSAQLFSEPAATFYRYLDGTRTVDPTYTQTNGVLADYRAALQARSLGPYGPPPYACR